MRTRSILGNVADTRKGLHEELGLMIQVKTWTTKALVETTQRGLEAKIAEVEAWVAQEVGGSRGTDTSRVETPIFDGSTSCFSVQII
jgi:hypothetical protein